MSQDELSTVLGRLGFHPIPLTTTKVGHFALRVHVNGSGLVFLLDTGASSTVLDSRIAGSLGLRAEVVDSLGGGLGATGVQTFKAPVQSLHFSGFDARMDTLFILDLSTVNKALTDNGADAVQGVVGADVLLKRNAVIDYAKAVLYLK